MYDDKVLIINMQFKDLSLRVKHHPKYELEYKIIFGDKSDNIPKIQTGMRCDQALKIAMMDEETRNKYLTENDLMNKYLFNKKLVDLRQIPLFFVNKFNDKYNIIIM
jgi:hypothetical protein